MKKFLDFIDDKAQEDLDKFISLYRNPLYTEDWWKEIIRYNRRISQLMAARISPQMKDKLLKNFLEIDGWMLKNYPPNIMKYTHG